MFTAFDLVSGGITNGEGDNVDYGEDSGSYNITSNGTDWLTFTCLLNTNVSVTIANDQGPLVPALIWLNNEDYHIPNPYIDPTK